MRINKHIIAIGCFMAIAFTMVASGVNEKPDSLKRTSNHELGFDLGAGYVTPNTSIDEMGTYTMGTAGLKYSFRFGRNTKFGRMYPLTRQGIGVNLSGFMPSKGLRMPVDIYVLQGAPIYSWSPRLSLNYEWNFGASVGWSHYSSRNPDFNASAKAMNAYINLGFYFRYRLNEAFTAIAGVSLSHYSNGNTNLPNPGINILGGRIGIAYTLGSPVEMRGIADDDGDFKRGWSMDVMVYGATRKRIYKDEQMVSDIPDIIPGHFGVTGINIGAMYDLNKYFRFGASLDGQYDESANMGRAHVPGTYGEDLKFYKTSFADRTGIGVSLRAELTMPVFAVNIGIGRNIIANGPDTRVFYQMINLKTYVWRGAFLNVGYQVRNFAKSNNLMLGLGYTFK